MTRPGRARKLAVVATLAVLAPLIVPHNTYDVASLSLMDAFLPPAWVVPAPPSPLAGVTGAGGALPRRTFHRHARRRRARMFEIMLFGSIGLVR